MLVVAGWAGGREENFFMIVERQQTDRVSTIMYSSTSVLMNDVFIRIDYHTSVMTDMLMML